MPLASKPGAPRGTGKDFNLPEDARTRRRPCLGPLTYERFQEMRGNGLLTPEDAKFIGDQFESMRKPASPKSA